MHHVRKPEKARHLGRALLQRSGDGKLMPLF
ncbi:hypothetical protein ACZ87_02732, partial [Candidatus Erwinia dacicola]